MTKLISRIVVLILILRTSVVPEHEQETAANISCKDTLHPMLTASMADVYVVCQRGSDPMFAMRAQGTVCL